MHLRACAIRKKLRTNLTKHAQTLLRNRLDKCTQSGFGDEFKDVTHILRTGDSGPHFHNRVVLDFESNILQTYDIQWETHTLCKLHAYSLCDAHGGVIKKYIRSFAINNWCPESAEQFACIINGITQEAESAHSQSRSRVNSRCTAYAFKNFNRS